MAQQTVKTRIRQKHETAENWSKATGFKPLDGELIVYNADDTQGPRLKVGDGATAAPDLPFAEAVPTGIYGVCSTAADDAAKTVVIENFKLKVGAMVIIKFTNANSIASPTLNIYSSNDDTVGTGAIPMYRYGTTAMSTGTTTTGWVAGAVSVLVYDGTGWIKEYWSNTTYSNVGLGQGYCTCSTDAATTAKTASLSSYALTTGGIVSVKFTNAVPANATLNINSKGAKNIYYKGAKITADVIKAGDIATFIYSSYYHLISIDRLATHKHTVSHTPAGTVSKPTFTGTEAGHTHSFSGSSSHDHSFTGTAASHGHTFTGTGTLIKGTFSGTEQTASVSYTPAGTVSTPTITVTPNTTTVNSITAVGSLPSLTYSEVKPSKITAWSAGTAPSASFNAGSGSASLTGSVSTGPNRTVTLTLSHTHTNPSLTFSAGTVPSLTYEEVAADNITAWSAGTLPTKGSNTTVVTSIKSATSTQPSFTGTAATISHKHTPTGTVTITTAAPGTGETANYTPAGTISSTSITPAGTVGSQSVSISGTTGETKITPAGTVSQPTFTGTAATLTTGTRTE